MFTLLHPELIPVVLEYPMGLLPLAIEGRERPILVVKASKEVLLTAQINKGFRIYIVPIDVGETRTVGLISAFFDDEDEPLVIFTPLFDDSGSSSLMDALFNEELDIHLFDEQGRELLGYAARIQMPPTAKARLEKARFLPPAMSVVRRIHDAMPTWFGLRTPADDADAIAVDFAEPLFPEDLFIQDIRPDNHAFHGSRGFSHTSLVRQEPGSFQEHDVVRLLQHIFRPEQIYLGPLRTTDKEEIADVIIITNGRILLIQAKDSPNTEQMLQHSLARKKATAIKSLKKALEQVKGAVRYVRSTRPMGMLVNGKELAVSIDHLELTSLIIVKELFNDQYSHYSPPLLKVAEKTQVPCIALDYSELIMYTAHLADEEGFFSAYNRVFHVGRARGEFPRLRITP